MELPLDVLIHNELLGLKGKEGTLLAVHEGGYFEVTTQFGERPHRVLLPIQSTVLISEQAEEGFESTLEVER